MIVADDELASLELDLGNPIVVDGRSVHTVGAGLVVAVPSLTALDVDDWSALINPTRIVDRSPGCVAEPRAAAHAGCDQRR